MLIGTGVYFGHDRYTTWQVDRTERKQKVARDNGTRACMTRLGTPMPAVEGVAPDVLPPAYFNNLAACVAYPDLGWLLPPAGFVPENLPAGYVLDSSGKVTTIPPGIPVTPKYTLGPPKQVSATPANPSEKARAIDATITCDIVVYDRSDYGQGDPQAIDSLHEGDTVQYVGHVTIGDQDIIKVHGRKGYVSGCVRVKR
jgi:hypothetical protein